MDSQNDSEKMDIKFDGKFVVDAETISSGIEEDEDKYEPVNGQIESDVENSVVHINSNIDMIDEVEKEFQDYLNEENVSDNLTEYTDNSREEIKQKIKKLENFNFESNNVEAMRQMAINRHGFVTKAFRRKAWPILISNNNNNNTMTQKVISKIGYH